MPEKHIMRLTPELVACVPPYDGETGRLAGRSDLATDAGDLRAIAFPISRRSNLYLPGLTTEVVVEALANAAGERGLMAEYLYSTVTHLEDRGIHDSYLWKMQDLVARRIERQMAEGMAAK